MRFPMRPFVIGCVLLCMGSARLRAQQPNDGGDILKKSTVGKIAGNTTPAVECSQLPRSRGMYYSSDHAPVPSTPSINGPAKCSGATTFTKTGTRPASTAIL
jgi:hypothetical protein